MEKNYKLFLLKEFMKKNSLTRAQASKALGISQASLSLYMTEKRQVSETVVILLEHLVKKNN